MGRGVGRGVGEEGERGDGRGERGEGIQKSNEKVKKEKRKREIKEKEIVNRTFIRVVLGLLFDLLFPQLPRLLHGVLGLVVVVILEVIFLRFVTFVWGIGIIR